MKSDVPADYSKVKSALRKVPLEDSFIHIWQYSRLVSGRVKLPAGYDHRDRRGYSQSLEKYIFPHLIELLAREVLLHADRSGKPTGHSLAIWEDLADVQNALNKFGNDVVGDHPKTDIMLTLHRIAQNQFPKYSRLTHAKIGRYLALYSTPALRSIFEEHLGISVEAYFALTYGVIASSVKQVQTNTKTDYGLLGVVRSESDLFFQRICGNVPEMRKKICETQRLNDCWEFTLNPFLFYPLIALDPAHPERVLCPVPPLLERRLLEGLYYDFVGKKGFDRALGDGLEIITGRILSSLRPRYEVAPAESKTIKKVRYDGTDWIVSDQDHCAFVECKAKRLSMPGKIVEKLADLDKDIAVLAEAVGQNYANIYREAHGSDGQDERQYFNIVITLEDWILFSDASTTLLRNGVIEQLKKRSLPEDMIEKVPYRVLSFETAMYCCAVLSNHSMTEVFGTDSNSKFGGMFFITDLKDRFPNADADSVGNFDDDVRKLMDPIIARAKVHTSNS